MRVMITGGRGFVGSAVVQHLARVGGFLPVVVDLKDGLDYRQVSVEDCDAVVHLAAHPSVQACRDDPVGAWQNNVVGFQHLLERLGDTLLVYASSASVYDGCPGLAAETWPTFRPRELYDLTKYVDDHLAQHAGGRAVGLRFGTVSGVSPVMRNDLMLQAMTRSALATGEIKVTNRNARRSFLSVRRLAAAVEAVLKHPLPPPGVYNLASFVGTVQEMAHAVARVVPARFDLGPDTGTYDFAMCCRKFQETFDFDPSDDPENVIDELRVCYENEASHA